MASIDPIVDAVVDCAADLGVDLPTEAACAIVETVITDLEMSSPMGLSAPALRPTQRVVRADDAEAMWRALTSCIQGLRFRAGLHHLSAEEIHPMPREAGHVR